MNKLRKSLTVLGILGACFAASAFGQTTTIPFDTAQQYTSNFNETYDPGNAMGWNSGRISIFADQSSSNTGNALYNPGATTSTIGPTYQTATVEFDLSTNAFSNSSGTAGILARAQLDGHAVCAFAHPYAGGLQVTVAYGLFNQNFLTVDGTLYNVTFTDFTFVPTHLTLYQYQTGGVPTFDFVLRNSAGLTRDTGQLFLTGTTAYTAAGEVGFYMFASGLQGVALDNFSITPSVPEPGTWSLCGLALVAGAGWLHRQRLA